MSGVLLQWRQRKKLALQPAPPKTTKDLQNEEILESILKETASATVAPSALPPPPPPKRRDSLDEVAASVKALARDKFGERNRFDLLLPLPLHFAKLLKLFECLEQSCAVMGERRRPLHFPVLQGLLEAVTEYHFDIAALQRIHRVFPEAYSYVRMEGKMDSKEAEGTNGKGGSPEGDPSCDADRSENVAGGGIADRTKNVEGSEDSGISGAAADTEAQFTIVPPYGPKIDVSLLKDRCARFRSRLLKIVEASHTAFLKSKALEIPAKLIRWHSEFRLDSLPPIETLELVFATTREVSSSINSKIGTKRKTISAAEAPDATHSKENKRSNGNGSPPPKLPGTKSATEVAADNNTIDKLFQRIKARKTQQNVDHVAAVKKSDTQRIMLGRSLEVCDILKTLFTAEKKTSLNLDEIKQRIADSSSTTYTFKEVGDIVRCICDAAPEWISLERSFGADFIQLSANGSRDKAKLRILELLNAAKDAKAARPEKE